MSNQGENVLYHDLAEKDPSEVCSRANCEYDTAAGCYRVKLWNETFEVYPDQSRVEREKSVISNGYLDIFLVNYLLQAKKIQPENRWVSLNDIPGGVGFFRGPHEIPTHRIAGRYGRDIDGFRELCNSLGGAGEDMADVSYSFRITPVIPVAVLLWKADDEFDAEAKIMYDGSIIHFPLDMIYALSLQICSKLSGSYNN